MREEVRTNPKREDEGISGKDEEKNDKKRDEKRKRGREGIRIPMNSGIIEIS